MDIVTDMIGVSEAGLAVQVAAAFQGTLIIFFIVSPMIGYIFFRFAEDFAAALLGTSAALGAVLVVNFGLNIIIRTLVPDETRLSTLAVTVLSFTAALAFAILLARYIWWTLGDPAKPQWMIDYENLPDEELMPFERKKRREKARRERARRI